MNDKELTFTLTVDEANVILNAIQELPARIANPLTKKLQEQAQPQMQQEQAEKEAE